MITKIKRINIKDYTLTFVGKYRYGKTPENKELDKYLDWKDWKIGFFFKIFKLVGKKNFITPKKWKDNLCAQYMFGIDFLIIKGWVTFSKGAMYIKINIK